MAVPSQQQIAGFRRRVFAQYRSHGRDLPWRKTKNPYHILVSEMMLQQTPVPRVVLFYRQWLRLFPTIKKLAAAPRAAVLRAWLGLGYNRRAVHLHEAARKIVSGYNSDVIAAVKDHKRIPGVGPYTAAAVRIFSRNENIAAVDTNIRRILIHEFKLKNSSSDKQLLRLAERLLPKGKSRDWHNALMDYGSLVLTSRKTGIRPKSQQPRFQGSDRQIRGMLLQFIVRSGSSHSFSSLQRKFSIPPQRLQGILKRMQEEDLLQYHHGCYAAG